ncbi:DegT/DnrJ/EryC1/StrS family aminotransferase [Nonomuraea typhae]|uniref:DegT/DnrJ/EryC1/StrS family aminotransferase n=1 Tax=Nonomuraea typhae TaxID=2603600 RepID=UPI0012FA85F8|nr:DegT/DnrJ/EryC1/StrS family aminotransferase [Nonomuraea typhae]
MAGPGFSFFGAEERKNIDVVMRTWALNRHAHDVPQYTSFVRRFELASESVFGAPYCVAVNSGTSALLTALAALGVGPGDEVIAPGYTFIAPIAAIVHAGAVPVLAEVDESFTLDPADVEARITPRTRAIMAVHMLGAPCDLEALRKLADRHRLLLVEDVAQSCGATFRGRHVGTYGHAGAFSLGQFTVITSGDGGFVLLPDEHLYRRAYSFQNQGWYPGRTDWGKGDVLFGLNLRMSELAGAVACAQLEKLDQVLAACRHRKHRLLMAIPDLSGFGVRRRTLHDPAGECGTLLVYVFDQPAHAQAVAKALDTGTMAQSGRHYYGHMPALTAIQAGEVAPCPFQRPARTQDYRVGALPFTDALLSRSVAISVGVSDSYMGAGFGLTVRSLDDEIDEVADRFTTAVITTSA